MRKQLCRALWSQIYDVCKQELVFTNAEIWKSYKAFNFQHFLTLVS